MQTHIAVTTASDWLMLLLLPVERRCWVSTSLHSEQHLVAGVDSHAQRLQFAEKHRFVVVTRQSSTDFALQNCTQAHTDWTDDDDDVILTSARKLAVNLA